MPYEISRTHAPLLAAGLGLIALACADDSTTTTSTTLVLTDSGTTGDGDPGDGDPGDGDPGDGDPTGDGDGDPGDGDGDPTGDGDGDPCVAGAEGCPCDMDSCDDGLNCVDGLCAQPSCGDGIVDPGEECDVGNETMFCDGDCTYASCGDGYHNMLSEECDDGNADSNDGCVGACFLAACGDGYIYEGVEECDDSNMIDTDECKADCSIAYCGDGVIWDGVEECDDSNMDETDACNGDCLDSFCGDGVIWQGMETCDDGNMSDTDACPSCEPAFCGDGFFWIGVEECDDGNNVDDDACANDCTANVIQIGDIVVGGNAFANITTALDALNQPYMVNNTQWLPTNVGDVLIMSNNGGANNPVNYTTFANNGGHVLFFGGSGLQAFHASIANYFSVGNSFNWHQSSDCMDDWNTGNAHPLTAQLPNTYEFPDQFNSFHMLHFNDANQPAGTTIIGTTCHQAPDNHTYVTRSYNNGGTITYVAYLLGQQAYNPLGPDFIEPLMLGYLNWLAQGAP